MDRTGGVGIHLSVLARHIPNRALKRTDSVYRSGRTRDWIKTKSPTAVAVQRIAH